MALLFVRSLNRLCAPHTSRLVATPLQSNSSGMLLTERASTVGSLPAGHENSDLRDVMCNIRLSRMRDITLRRDVSLYEEGKPVTLASIFKVFSISILVHLELCQAFREEGRCWLEYLVEKSAVNNTCQPISIRFSCASNRRSLTKNVSIGQ